LPPFPIMSSEDSARIAGKASCSHFEQESMFRVPVKEHPDQFSAMGSPLSRHRDNGLAKDKADRSDVGFSTAGAAPWRKSARRTALPKCRGI